MTGIDPRVLVLSTGISDLEPILVTHDGQRLRGHVLRHNRSWHEAVLEGRLLVEISVSPEDAALPEVPIAMQAPCVPEKGVELLDGSGQHARLEWRDRRMHVVAPKLLPLRKMLSTRLGEPLAGLIVFYSHRDAGHGFASEEPIATGKLFTEWFRPLVRPDALVEAVPYLLARESLEDIERQLPLNHQAARRIEAALRRLYRQVPDACLILAAEGGPPAVKEHITATATLFYPATRIFRHTHTAQGIESAISPPSDTDAVRARRHALDHLRRGRFAEAYAAVRDFEHDPEHAAWIDPLFYAHQFMTHHLIRPDPQRRPLPVSLKRLLEQRFSRSLWVALRVEAALTRASWFEAIQSTLTFFDCLLLDAIQKKLPAGAKLMDRQRLIQWPPNIPVPDILREGVTPILKPIDTQGRYRYDAVGANAQKCWLAWLNEPSLEALAHALYGDWPDREQDLSRRYAMHEKPPSFYRNLSTHNRLGASELERARESFIRAGLWASTLTHPGSAFLAVPKIATALGILLEERQPAHFYRDLVRELEAALLDPDGGLVPQDEPFAPFIAA